MKRAAMLLIAIALPGQSHSTVVLWRTLQAGDSVEVAKAKTEVMSEVDRVKIKKKGDSQQLDVIMKDGAVPIFDGHFAIDVGFHDGRLSKVQLTSGAGCLEDAYPLASKIDEELSKKYPGEAFPFPDRSAFILRALDSSDSRMTRVFSGYVSEEIGVLFEVTFIQRNPPVYYGGSAVSRSVYQLARSTYDLGARKCGGAYYRTGQLRITYMSRTEWDAIVQSVEKDGQAERREAGDNL